MIDYCEKDRSVNGLTVLSQVVDVITNCPDDKLDSKWISVKKEMPKEHDSIFAKWKNTNKWLNGMFEKVSDNVNVTVKFSDGNHIYFRNKYDRITHGQLDVDIINPSSGVPAVENIVWTDKEYIKDCIYHMFVHCYSNNGGKSGFKAEIEINGEIYSYNYNKPLRYGETVDVADVLVKNGKISLGKEYIDSDSASLDFWGLKTNNFIPVKAIMYSPNYWDEQNGIGNKHYFFMLDGCVNPENPNGFYNEYLKQELSKHKNVFEALGSKLSVVDADDQLSGVGFSSTIRNNIIVKVKGNIERVMKIKF